MVRLIKVFLLVIILPYSVIGQNVGINPNGTLPNTSAMLDIEANDKGLLIPRVVLTARNIATPVTSPATSLLVYNTATAGVSPNDVSPGYYYWDGTQWVRLLSSDMTITDDDWYRTGTTLAPTSINDSIYTHGFVGIGTNAPGVNLHIQNNLSSPRVLLESTGPYSSSITFRPDSGPTDQFNIGLDDSDNKFKITNQGGFGVGDVITVEQNGKVGINTNTPVSILDVKDTVNIKSGYYRGFDRTIGFGTGQVREVIGTQSSTASGEPGGGFGFVTGPNQLSPIIWMYGSGGQNAFQVINKSWAGNLSTDATLFHVDVNGNVGVATDTPSPDAILHVESNNKGVLLPKVDLTSAINPAPINLPSVGLLVYNNVNAGVGNTAVTPGYYYWDGSRWQRFQTHSYAGIVMGSLAISGPNLTSTTWVYTGSSITLPPGRWIVYVSMLGAASGANLPNGNAVWVRSSFSDSPTTFAYSSNIIGSPLISGKLVGPCHYGMISGQVIINNTTNTSQTYYYWGSAEMLGGYAGFLNQFGGTTWGENKIYALPAD